MTNFRALDLTLTRITVFDPADTLRPLGDFSGPELADLLFHPGGTPDSADIQRIRGGTRAIAYLWLSADSTESVPARLKHRLFFTFTDSRGARVERFVDGGEIDVPSTELAILGFPVRNGIWLFANGPANDADHRRAILALDGRAQIAQRYGYDIMRFGDDRRLMKGDPAKNESWFAYGEEVLAVADGTVRAVVGSLSENVPLSSTRAVRMTVDNISGNYLVLDLGNSRYAVYAHLIPGSIRVKVGDRVKRGVVMAKIGNSGNSDAPHLHFHVVDHPHPLAAEGLPYVFEAFTVLRTFNLFQRDSLLDPGVPWTPDSSGSPAQYVRELPLGHAVVRIP